MVLVFEKIKARFPAFFPKEIPPHYKKAYSFSSDWFTGHIPIWSKALKDLAHKENIRALEIGTFEGRSAFWLLENILTHPTSSLICIDIFVESRAKKLFEKNLEIGKFGKRLHLIVDDSLKVLPHLQSQKFDLIYLDGNHDGDHVLEETKLCWSVLVVGGILIFDDYELQLGHGPRPKVGIDRFLATYGDRIEILHKRYQVIVKKIAE